MKYIAEFLVEFAFSRIVVSTEHHVAPLICGLLIMHWRELSGLTFGLVLLTGVCRVAFSNIVNHISKIMSKRPADSALEENEAAATPRPKKVRIGNVVVGGGRPPARVEDGSESGEEVEGGSEDEEEENLNAVQKTTEPPEGYSDLYLDTVNRWDLSLLLMR